MSTIALHLRKPSSDCDSGFRHGFGAEASLPLAQRASAESHDTTRLCQIVVTLWDCHIHTDADRALSWIFSVYFLLSNWGSHRVVKKTEVELTIKPQYPTSVGNTFVIQPFLTHCSRRSSNFSNLRRCARSKFSSKGTANSITWKERKQNRSHYDYKCISILLWVFDVNQKHKKKLTGLLQILWIK